MEGTLIMATKIRVRKDGFGRITAPDGTILHERIRYQQAFDDRIAVWDGDTKKTAFPPTTVYAAGEASAHQLGGCPPCQGYTPRMVLTKLWEKMPDA